ncbi:MAG: hypothetical protein QW743_07135 [Candidatus Methanomethylicia archaeon]
MIIGGDPLSDKIIERLNRVYQIPYYWNINEYSRVNMEEYKVKLVNGEVSNSKIEEMISESSEIIFTIPLTLMNEKTLKALNNVLKCLGEMIMDVTIGVYQQTKNIEEKIMRMRSLLDENKTRNWKIIYLGEVYGEGVNIGIIFEILQLLKEDCINISLPLHSEEKRNYIYVDDAARAMLSKSVKGVEEKMISVKNVSINNRALIKRITELLGVDVICNVKFNNTLEITNPPDYPQPKDFKAKINLIDGLKRTIGWFEGEYGPIQVIPKNNRNNVLNSRSNPINKTLHNRNNT